MKKIVYRAAAVILFASFLTACNIIFPDDANFVVIYKSEWGLIEATHEHEYIDNSELDDPSKNKDNEEALHNTRQIQAALDHFTAQGYKNIRLERGTYYVGGRKEKISWSTGTQNWINPEMIRIQPKHSGLNFDLGGATLKLEPHDRVESRVIWIYSDRNGATKDIKIFNGTIIGDRVKHKYHDPYIDWNAARADGFSKMSSHEWGSGIDIWGDVRNVELYNLRISEVTGDCIGANGFNITIRNCEIWRGRRNGIVSVYVDGLTIHNNHIHHCYNGGTPFEGYPDSQHEYFGRGIGAESCIAFEHTENNYFDRQINIKIYNNRLDGQKPEYRNQTANSRYYMDNALNTHWGTYAMWVYNNDIIGDWEWSCGGSNTLIENNRFLTRGYKGYSISKGLVASGPTSDTGRSAASFVVIRNNYFENYNVIAGGAAGGVSDSQPDWRHDYAIVDNVFVYNEPRVFSGSSGDGYYTGICASVNNTVVMGNVFDVRYAGYYIGTRPDSNWDYAEYTWKPLQCAIYIDVFDSGWGNRLPNNLKVDLYIAGNQYKGPVWREKYYVLNNNYGLQSLTQYERPTDSRMPGNYSETNNYQAVYAKYQEILRKTISVGNIWGRTK